MGKLVIIQMTSHMLKITPVNKSGGKHVYGIPVPFLLPEALVGGSMSQNIFNFADFSNNCLKKMGLKSAKIIICIDDGSVISKEFLHLPAEREALLATAKLEAELVLPDGTEDYFIEVCSYRDTPLEDGKLKSILYAIPSELVNNILKQFKRYGLKIIRIAPSISGLVEAGRCILSALSDKTDRYGKIVAFVDLGFEKIQLAMFNNGEPVFEKAFDSVYDDIIDILCDTLGLELDSAERRLRQDGISSTGIASNGVVGKSQEQIDLLVETACGEVIRNIRVVLSSERLELDSIVFCGSFTSLPGFADFLLRLGLDVPYLNLEKLIQKVHQDILLLETTVGAGLRNVEFFTLSGLVSKNKGRTINFLRIPQKGKSDAKATVALMAILTILMAGAMSIQPLIHRSAILRAAEDQRNLDDPALTEVKELVALRDSLEAELSGLEADLQALPFEKSKTNQSYEKIFNTLTANSANVTNFSLDNNTGIIGLSFITSDFSSYLKIRNQIIGDSFFLIAVPFTAVRSNSAYVPIDQTVLDGAVLDGAVLDGAVTDGVVTDGAVTDGAVTDGVVLDGAAKDGEEAVKAGGYDCRVTLKINGFETFPKQEKPQEPQEPTGDGEELLAQITEEEPTQ